MTIFVDLYHVLADPSLWLIGVLIWCSCAIVVAVIWWIVLRHETRKANAEVAAWHRREFDAVMAITHDWPTKGPKGFEKKFPRVS
jgi:cytochrome c-type biogenesis protein CcmH/NrfF